MTVRDLLLILDYDRLASRMAVRKLRAERVCCRIVPWDVDGETLAREDPAGLVLCAAADTPDITVTAQVPVTPLPSLAVAVMVAVPAATAVTTPSATVATLASLVVHVTVLSVALAGRTVGVSVSVSPPTVMSAVAGSRVMPVTATVEVSVR